jgi:hypothetical protein
LALPVTANNAPPPACPVGDLLRSVHTRRVGFHIVDLPVTTESADAAGRELWGYPKFVTDIDFRLQQGRLLCRVHDPQDETAIMTLAGQLGAGLPSPALDLVTYSRRGRHRLRTVIQTRGGGRLYAGGRVRLRIGGARHRMARHLHTLGLDAARPLLVWISTRFQSRLYPGARMAEGQRPGC